MSHTNFFVCQVMLFKFLFDLFVNYSIKWPTLRDAIRCRNINMYQLIYWFVWGTSTAIGMAMFGASRDFPFDLPKSFYDLVNLVSFLCSLMNYLLWGSLSIYAYFHFQKNSRVGLDGDDDGCDTDNEDDSRISEKLNAPPTPHQVARAAISVKVKERVRKAEEWFLDAVRVKEKVRSERSGEERKTSVGARSEGVPHEQTLCVSPHSSLSLSLSLSLSRR